MGVWHEDGKVAQWRTSCAQIIKRGFDPCTTQALACPLPLLLHCSVWRSDLWYSWPAATYADCISTATTYRNPSAATESVGITWAARLENLKISASCFLCLSPVRLWLALSEMKSATSSPAKLSEANHHHSGPKAGQADIEQRAPGMASAHAN